jgi:hypothetical protein
MRMNLDEQLRDRFAVKALAGFLQLARSCLRAGVAREADFMAYSGVIVLGSPIHGGEKYYLFGCVWDQVV